MLTALSLSKGILPFAFFLSGCVAFQVGGEVEKGRAQLMFGDPKVALAHFQRAAEMDPEYIRRFSVFQQGVWGYLGRAHYATGKLSEARTALERALSHYRHDYLARLYLGLVLARDGDRQRGLKEMEGGMRGIHDWLEDITYNTNYGRFWDPLREIRSGIESNLAMISGREVDWQKLIAGGEWVGMKMEDEIDRARRDEFKERFQDSEGQDSQP